jgi:hypothetical protein
VRTTCSSCRSIHVGPRRPPASPLRRRLPVPRRPGVAVRAAAGGVRDADDAAAVVRGLPAREHAGAAGLLQLVRGGVRRHAAGCGGGEDGAAGGHGRCIRRRARDARWRWRDAVDAEQLVSVLHVERGLRRLSGRGGSREVQEGGGGGREQGRIGGQRGWTHGRQEQERVS